MHGKPTLSRYLFHCVSNETEKMAIRLRITVITRRLDEQKQRPIPFCWEINCGKCWRILRRSGRRILPGGKARRHSDSQAPLGISFRAIWTGVAARRSLIMRRRLGPGEKNKGGSRVARLTWQREGRGPVGWRRRMEA